MNRLLLFITDFTGALRVSGWKQHVYIKYKNDNVDQVFNYVDNKLTGISVALRENGAMRCVYSWRNDKRYGRQIYYDDYGFIRNTCVMLNNKLFDKNIWYFNAYAIVTQDNRVRNIKYYDNNKPQGRHISLKYDGTVFDIQRYINDSLYVLRDYTRDIRTIFEWKKGKWRKYTMSALYKK